ncbi:Predicted DNA binding protein, contains HTH domain [Haladaptatus litoreus]|uniref:Predicted DNA binding protein, contains HTH domain n=2 Tax=Haladaptatus litoreus TaxID=553468 RepID=A0A1N7BCS1_9EURY|nr:Predicted DNA binding protein, contains HTH domain [Haladaptatus litoreus]
MTWVMISVTMDMVQYDCPYIDVTDEVDVSFHTMHWDFNTAKQKLETRILVTGDDRGALTNGLSALKSHDGMLGFELLSRRENTAVIKSFIGQTNAMRTIREHDGYITGPFQISDGSELWSVGFDTADNTDNALSALEDDNDFRVESRNATSFEDYLDVIQHLGAAKNVLDGCRDLSERERQTLKKAVDGGYFQTPRNATLGTLAEEFDVSKTAASKNLRRAEGKVLERIVSSFPEVEDETVLARK